MKPLREDEERFDEAKSAEVDDPGLFDEKMPRRIDFFQEIHVIRAAIIIIACGVGVTILHYASPILIPIVLAVFLSYVLNPFVAALMKLRVPGTQLGLPRSLAALIVVVLMVLFTGVVGVFIADQVRRLAMELPHYEDRITRQVTELRTDLLDIQTRVESVLEPIRRYPEAGAEAEEMISTEAAEASVQERVQVFLEQSGSSEFWSSVTSYIAGGITGLLGFFAQALMCIFVLVFILSQAPVFRTKIINILGKDLRQRRLVLEILRNVNEDIQRYLFNRFATNSVIAILVALSFYIYGLKYAFLLGILAGIFNFIPYVGPIVGTFFPALIAYMQFGDLQSVVWCVLIYGAITGIEGNLVTPVVIGRHLKLNSLAVLLSAIFWGWLWGAIGLLLAIPIIAAVKAVSEHIDGLRPLGELLRG